MLKINHDTIEYNNTPVLEFTPSTPDYIRRDIRDTLEFALHDAGQIEAGEYIEISEYNDIKRDKENYESSCQNTRLALERLLDALDKVMEQDGLDALQALKDVASDLTVICEEIEK